MAKQAGLSQRKMVADAIDAMGTDVSSQQIHDWIMKTYPNSDMKMTNIAAYKSGYLKALNGGQPMLKKKRGRKPKFAGTAPAPMAPRAAISMPSKSDVVSVKLMEDVKALMSMHGAEQLNQAIKLLS
ncbi:MAG: hypothetical protein ACRCZF_08535 [Gemmataceae bacterium]